MERPLRYLRYQLSRWDLWPTTRLARATCYLLALDLGLKLLGVVLGLFKSSYSQSLSGWITFLSFVVTVLVIILSYRWLKAKLLWRLRNRLIVTYVFIGVIPAVLLVVMSFVTIYLFAGQFANFVVTSDLESRLRSLGTVNSAIANELAARLEHGGALTADSLDGLRRREPATAPRQLCAWKDSKPLPLCGGTQGTVPFVLPASLGPRFSSIVNDGGKLFLRAGVMLDIKGQKLAVVSSEPLDRQLLEKIASDLGEISLYTNSPEAGQPKSSGGTILAVQNENQQGFSIREGANGSVVEGAAPVLVAGVLPSSAGWLDRDISFPAPLPAVDWQTGESDRAGVLVKVQTRPSALYARLFTFDAFAKGVETGLIALAIVQGVIVAIALVIGTRLTRTVTAAVAQLYVATRHINRGDFSHRIPVRSNDQLSTLAHSFNSMSESLQKLVLEQKEKQKLENELVIAQEVQAQLFPRQISQMATLEVHGFCRPARTVSGDYYDFLNMDTSRMVMAVGDVSGKGISAALLMATINSAVRAYSMEGIPILREALALEAAAGSRSLTLDVQGVEVSTAALLTLLNHQLYQSTPPEKYATLFLGYYDERHRRLTYSNAGHLPPIIMSTDGSVRRLDCGGTVIGLFEHVHYDESSVQLHDGDIFLAYSDGVTEPENDYGEFGETRLIDLVWENRQLPLAQISEIVTAAVDDWIGANEQPDDVTLVLARAR